MRRSGNRSSNPHADLIQVVLDDATADRLRTAAGQRGMEVEQLIVDLLHTMSVALIAGDYAEEGAPAGARGPTSAS